MKLGNKKKHIIQCIKEDIYALKMDNKETTNQAEIENTIEQELQDYECEQQEKAIEEVNKNYQNIPKARKDSLIKRIGWNT